MSSASPVCPVGVSRGACVKIGPREGKGREGKGREGKGREGKGREGKGKRREGRKGRTQEWKCK